jgi:hypothetical protein
MSVLIRIGEHKAILRAGVWMSANPGLEAQLNEATTTWIRQTGGPAFSERDQEKSVAKEMAGRFKGRILLLIPSRRRDSEHYFFSQRQMQLDFSGSVPLNKRKASA